MIIEVSFTGAFQEAAQNCINWCSSSVQCLVMLQGDIFYNVDLYFGESNNLRVLK